MIYLIYTTDFNHTYNSREIIALGSTPEKCISLIKEHAQINKVTLPNEQISLLESIKQTQGLDQFEYQFEEFNTNILI